MYMLPNTIIIIGYTFALHQLAIKLDQNDILLSIIVDSKRKKNDLKEERKKE